MIQCEGTEISRVIYPLGILMAGEMNYTHPQKRLMVINPLEHFHQKSPTNCSNATLDTKLGKKMKRSVLLLLDVPLLAKVKIFIVENCQESVPQ